MSCVDLLTCPCVDTTSLKDGCSHSVEVGFKCLSLILHEARMRVVDLISIHAVGIDFATQKLIPQSLSSFTA